MSLKENLTTLQSQIRAASKLTGNGREVKLIAVTKTRTFQTIKDAYRCGIKSIGENRVQEADSKFKTFKEMPGLEKRFIGHLQSNKIKKCLLMFDTIDSIHSLRLARKINNHLIQEKMEIKALLEINMSGDEQKNGFSPDNKEEIISSLSLSCLKVEGLMTVGPASRDKQETRKAFEGLRKLKDELNKEMGKESLTELSMGMSGDFELGIEEGSTMVRVGTALFGKRN